MFDEVMKFLDSSMTKPTPYGWFHLMWLGLTIITTFLLIMFFRNSSEKTIRKIIFIFGIIIFFMEIYKMINFSYNPETQVWDFQWYAFPFQFCSTPIYVCLLVGFTSNKKLLDALYNYIAIFILFAGLCVVFYPVTIFVSTIGINIQTAFLHCGMVVLGIFMIAWKKDFNLKSIINASFVFITFLLIAMILNIGFHFTGINETFNMFFISPYYPCTLIILDKIYLKAPYIIFLLTYMWGFITAGFIVLLIGLGIKKILSFNNPNAINNEKQL